MELRKVLEFFTRLGKRIPNDTEKPLLPLDAPGTEAPWRTALLEEIRDARLAARAAAATDDAQSDPGANRDHGETGRGDE